MSRNKKSLCELKNNNGIEKIERRDPKNTVGTKNTIQEPKKTILGLKAPIWELETPMAQPAMVHQKLLNTKKLAL
jgi:hypothetical protein